MWGNKSRTALVVLSIAVGVFAIGVISGSQGTISSRLNDSYLGMNPDSGTITTLDEFDDDLVETINGIREIEVAEGRREFSVNYKINPEDGWQSLTLTALDDFTENEIGTVTPEAGDWPPPKKSLVIERAALESVIGAEIGDTLYIETSDDDIVEMEIVGTAVNLNGPPAALSGQASGFVSRETLEWLDESRDYNQLLFIVAENTTDEAHIESVADLIEAKFQNANVIVRNVQIPPPGEHPANTVIEPLLMILNGLGGLALALSGFLVINTISAILAQQTRQIGIMKSIGARQSDIGLLYFLMVFLFGLLALVIALPLSAVGARLLSEFLLSFFNTDLGDFAMPTWVLGLQAVVGLLVPMAAAIYPIWAGTRVTVREAISDYGVGDGFGEGLIDRILKSIRGISRPLMLSLRNTFRRKGRLSLTLITLTLAGTTFITIYSTRDSMTKTVDELFDSFGFDVLLFFDKPYRMVEVERTTSQIDDFVAAENWGRATVQRIRPDDRESEEIILEAPPFDTMMYNPDVLDGRWLVDGDTTAVVVNTDFLDEETDVNVGDQIVLELNSREYVWDVVGIVQGTMAGSTVYVNHEYYSQLTHNIGRVMALRVALDEEAIANINQTLPEYEAILDEAGIDVSSTITLSEMQAGLSNAFDFLVSFLIAMAMILAAVGGLGLSGTMSMNVLERVREIGVMRAVGASDGMVLQLVLVEGVLVGMISWALGAIIAIPLSYVSAYLLGVSLLSSPLTFQYSLFGLGLWLAIAVILAMLASFFPARNASQLTVREVLSYE
jgi:putative ABC transport system permease protein